MGGRHRRLTDGSQSIFQSSEVNWVAEASQELEMQPVAIPSNVAFNEEKVPLAPCDLCFAIEGRRVKFWNAA